MTNDDLVSPNLVLHLFFITSPFLRRSSITRTNCSRKVREIESGSWQGMRVMRAMRAMRGAHQGDRGDGTEEE